MLAAGESRSSLRAKAHMQRTPTAECTTNQICSAWVDPTSSVTQTRGAAPIPCGLSQSGTPPHSNRFQSGSSWYRVTLTRATSSILWKNGASWICVCG